MKKKIMFGAFFGMIALISLVAYTLKQQFDIFLIEDSIHGDFYPVVVAILEYTEDQSTAPKELIELVPAYLPEIPDSEIVNDIEFSSEGKNWNLTLHSIATGKPRTYQARLPKFTEEEIESSSLFYHTTWLVNEG